MTALVLHNFFRSSTSVRVRVALNLKGLSYEYVPHHLRKAEHRSAEYLKLNPQGLVPALILENGTVLTQSLAIMEYLDETHPTPALLPAGAEARARVRALALAVACEIHPINNLRVLGYIKSELGASEDKANDWFRHWVKTTFDPLEQTLASSKETGRFCHGDTPGLADICLYAQVLNNQRFNVDMSRYPVISRIYDACSALPAFANAAPMKQPDAE